MRRVLSTLGLVTLLFLGGFFVECTLASSPNYFVIQNDSGGVVIEYALRMLKLRRSGMKVKIVGACHSACTLYLALPRYQICITSDTVFKFHSPTSPFPRMEAIFTRYMWTNYPTWVQQWLDKQGGLSSTLLTMENVYARQYLSLCK